jgi:imidazolonepropionase-like amidohydrolase
MQELVDRRVVLGVTVGLVPSTVEGAGPPPAMVARLPGIIANTRRLYELGAVMVAGTDAGISLLKPHDVVRYAPAMLRMSGMTSIETLQAVTSVAATACGLGDVKGRLAVGYDADVLAVDGDPVTDPGALHRIRAVYARGTRVR